VFELFRSQGAVRVTLTDLPDKDVETAARDTAETVIYVCTTCRRPEDPEDYPRPGAALAEATLRAAESAGVTVTPLRCLANCKRGCTAVLRSPDAWTYVFGNLDPAADAQALVLGAKLLSQSADGLMPWRGRPDALKRGLIARIPPFGFTEPAE
jgi:predicted metal-binding protein